MYAFALELINKTNIDFETQLIKSVDCGLNFGRIKRFQIAGKVFI